MRTVLYVDCCIRREQSRTKRLADAFLSALPSDCRVEHLDLMAEDLSYFKDSYFAQREQLLAADERDHPRFRYAHQFAEADLIVMAAPFWDLAFPALLKVYIEQVSVDGITFGSTEAGLRGLCRASKLVFLTTRGGFYTGDAMEMGGRYLRHRRLYLHRRRRHGRCRLRRRSLPRRSHAESKSTGSQSLSRSCLRCVLVRALGSPSGRAVTAGD